MSLKVWLNYWTIWLNCSLISDMNLYGQSLDSEACKCIMFSAKRKALFLLFKDDSL